MMTAQSVRTTERKGGKAGDFWADGSRTGLEFVTLNLDLARRKQLYEPLVNLTIHDQVHSISLAPVVHAVRQAEVDVPGLSFVHRQPFMSHEKLDLIISDYGNVDPNQPIFEPHKMVFMLENF